MNELLSMSNFINVCEYNCSMIQKKHFKKAKLLQLIFRNVISFVF